MIIRDIQDIPGTNSEVATKDWTSRRLLLKKDGMGFSLHETIIRAGARLVMHYKHHLEAVYCIEGKGLLQDLENHTSYTIQPGILYALNANDRHILEAHCYMRMVCVFNPPLIGQETHDKEGTFPLDSHPSVKPKKRR